MTQFLIIILMMVAFSLPASADSGKSALALPGPPKGEPILVENNSKVILKHFDHQDRTEYFTLWNPVTGELKPLDFPKGVHTYSIEGIYHSTDGWFILDGVYLSYIPPRGQLEKIELSDWGGYKRLIPLSDHSILVEGKFPNKSTTNGVSYLVSHVWLDNGTLKVSPPLAIPAVSGRGFAIVALADGRAMVLGGTNEQYVGCEACVANTFFLDPKTWQWTPGPNMLEPRDDATATLLPDGSVLVAGGYTPGEGSLSTDVASRTTERWMPAENRFVADAPMPVGIAGHRAQWVVGQRGRQLLILGGENQGTLYDHNPEILDYDVTTGTWRKVGTVSRAVSQPAGTTLNDGKIFLWDQEDGPTGLVVTDLLTLNLSAPKAIPPGGTIRVAPPKGAGSPAGYRNQIDKGYLLSVAENGPPEQLKWLISQGADVNTRDDLEYAPQDDQGNTLLMFVLRRADFQSTQMLIAGGADINAQNAEGLTPLMLASQSSCIKCVKELLSRNANVNAQDKSGQTALLLALQQDQVDVPPLLIEKNADVNLASSNGITPLMLAASKGHADLVKELINHGADVNAITRYGFTALRAAAQYRQREAVQELLAAGAKR